MRIRYYQLAYLLSPELKKEEIEKIKKDLASFFEKEGILDKVEEPLKRTLFYPIKKKTEAFLGTIYFYLEPEKIKELEKELKKEEKILRYLIVSEKAPKKVKVEGRIKKPEKVELEEIEKKLEEILKE
jgi:small subunit ribosomal protein S6